MMEPLGILNEEINIINIGLEGFAEDQKTEGVAVVHVDWRPPTGGDQRLAALLANLDDDD